MAESTESVALETNAEPRSRTRKRKHRCHIDRRLHPLKGFYFMFHAAIAALIPYLLVYLKQQGLSAGETGVVFGSMPFLSCLAQPLLGAAADRWRKHKAVLIAATLATGFFHLLFLAVPARTSSVGNLLVSEAQFTCGNQSLPRLSVCETGLEMSVIQSLPCFDYLMADVNNLTRDVRFTSDSSTSMCANDHGENVKQPCWQTVFDLLQEENVRKANNSLRHCQVTCKMPPEHAPTVEVQSISNVKSTLEFEFPSLFPPQNASDDHARGYLEHK